MSTLAPADRRFGVEIECGHEKGCYGVEAMLQKAKIPHQNVDFDGSGVEVRTNPLKGKKGFRDLQRLMRYLQKIGCYITTADGQHIHLEALDYAEDAELRARLVESYIANRDTIIKFVHPYRRNYSSCRNMWGGQNKKPKANLIDGVKQGQLYSRADLNLSNLLDTGTIEIRLHEGNLEFEKIQAWIHFWMDFLDHVKASRRPLRPYVNEHTMFRGVRVDPAIRNKLREAAKRYEDGSSTIAPRRSND